MKPVGLKRSWHHLNRYQEILKVFVKYGFWDIVERIRVRLLLDISKKILPRLEKKEFTVIGTSVRLRLALKKLSPTFIKLGQMLSLRQGLIPLKITNELTKLQDEVAPLPFAIIQPYIEKEYHKPLADIFAEFDENTIAAASLTQVHKIKLKSNQEVAVKISLGFGQWSRPGISSYWSVKSTGRKKHFCGYDHWV